MIAVDTNLSISWFRYDLALDSEGQDFQITVTRFHPDCEPWEIGTFSLGGNGCLNWNLHPQVYTLLGCFKVAQIMREAKDRLLAAVEAERMGMEPAVA